MDELVDAVSAFSPVDPISVDIASVQIDFNVAPTRLCAVITRSADGLSIEHDRWGLVPAWSKEAGIGSKMINARCETLAEKPSFRHLLRGHRCLVPMSGFYEWSIDPVRGKVPHYVECISKPIIFAAGLWTRSPILDNMHTFTIITRSSFASTSWLHHRSPAILTDQQCRRWLVEETAALAMLDESPDFPLQSREVSKRVNSVKHNDGELLRSVEGDQLF